jgi:acyl carrier protein
MVLLAMKRGSTERLDGIFRAVFNLGPDADVSKIESTAEVSWDSLTHVALIAAIESEFHCSIDAGDAVRLNSYQAARTLLEEKGM